MSHHHDVCDTCLKNYCECGKPTPPPLRNEPSYGVDEDEQPTPSPLTREQAESRLLILKANTTGQVYDCACALAQYMAQQAQEIERLKNVNAIYNTVVEQANTIIKQRDELVLLQHRFDDAIETINKLQATR